MKYRIIASIVLLAVLAALVFVIEGGPTQPQVPQAPQGNPNDKDLSGLKIN